MFKLRSSVFAKDLLFIVLLTIFAGMVLTNCLVTDKLLYWDNRGFFSFFWNQMDSLNRFGEFAWWFPANQGGWPGYYYSILGDVSCITPAFAILGFFSWISGFVGLRPSSFYDAFLFYYAYLVPFMATLGIYFVGRQILKTRAALAYALILSAFSPGVLTNVSDIGFLEPLAYSLYFLAAWIFFLRFPEKKKSFWLLCLSCCLLAVGLGYPFILWNVFFVPMCILITSFIPQRNFKNVIGALQKYSKAEWALFLCAVVVCVLPPLITFTQVSDLIRSTLGQEFYDYNNLRIGNPLEALMISVPQFGFSWRDDATSWTALPGASGYNIGTVYLGLLCFPFAFAALLYGARVFKFRMIVMLAFFVGLASLSVYSPLFRILIHWIRPLQSNDHYSDLLFRAGTFQLFIALAAVGFDILVQGRSLSLKRALPWLAVFNLIVGVAVYVGVFQEKVLGNSSFGLMIFLSGLSFTLLTWSSKVKKIPRFVVLALIVLTIIDVSTFNFIHMRKAVATHGTNRRPEEVATGSVGIAPIGDYVDNLLMKKPLFMMVKTQFPLNEIAQFKLFNQIHLSSDDFVAADFEREKNLFAKGMNEYQSLLVSVGGQDASALNPFLDSSRPALGGKIEIQFQSYNALKIKVESSAAAVLFVRDGFSPYWKAEVNGQPTDIFRALFNFKAIVVPAGASEVELRFKPSGVPISIFSAYLVILAVLGLALLNAVKAKR